MELTADIRDLDGPIHLPPNSQGRPGRAFASIGPTISLMHADWKRSYFFAFRDATQGSSKPVSGYFGDACQHIQGLPVAAGSVSAPPSSCNGMVLVYTPYDIVDRHRHYGSNLVIGEY